MTVVIFILCGIFVGVLVIVVVFNILCPLLYCVAFCVLVLVIVVVCDIWFPWLLLYCALPVLVGNNRAHIGGWM